jgi:hypothetical protein
MIMEAHKLFSLSNDREGIYVNWTEGLFMISSMSLCVLAGFATHIYAQLSLRPFCFLMIMVCKILNYKKETKLRRGIISTIMEKVQQIKVITGNATGKIS